MIIVGENTTSTGIIVEGGEMHISSGGVANDTMVDNFGYMYISSGGVANDTLVCDLGEIHISNGGVANDTMLDFDSIAPGSMFISSGGVANNTTVDYGYMYISSGGVANDTLVCAFVGEIHISNGGVANSTTLRDGNMYISSGGVANSTTVDIDGSMFISSGGEANDTTVDVDGSMFISSGGVANNTTVNVAGSMFISSGGVVNSTTMSGGYMHINDGGVANNTTLNDWNSIVIYGEANSTTVNVGSMFICSGGVANNTTVNVAGSMFISSGGVVNSTTVNSGGGIIISRGGVANSTTLNSDGRVYISSGGVANSTTVNSGGSMYISSGGTATDIVVAEGGRLGITIAPDTYIQWTSNGSAFEMKDASINGYTLNSGCIMWVSSGGVANGTTLNSGGIMWVSSGGTATDIVVAEGGRLGITVAPDTYIQWTSNGSAFEMKDASINGYTLNSGGSMYIFSGGVANSTTVNSRGSMYISRGGTALEIIENGGYVYVADGAEVTFASNTFNGLELTAQSATVHSGTTATDITLNSGGKMYIYGDGVANSTTVNSGGSMYISSGGIMKGNLEIADGGKVTVYEGGIIDFTVAEQKSADAALINDLSRITDNGAVYTLTVAEDQVFGDYVLAGNAAAFDKTITVKTDEAELGKLTVGNDFVIDGVTYALKLVDTNLVFMVDDITPPELDVSLKQNISLDYEFEVKISEPASLQYKIDNGEWQDADGTTIAIAQNGTYSFRAEDLTGNMSEVVTKEISGLVFGNPEKVETDGGKTSWTPVKDESGNVQQVVVQYSMDNFKTVVTVVTTESALQVLSAAGNMQWRVKGKNSVEWSGGGEVAAADTGSPKKIESVTDGVADIFFAHADGTWSLQYRARHQGIKNGWEGTKDRVYLSGKGKIVDVFSGAGDVDILYLTDSSNGDALFVDDIFGASFEGIAQTQARIAKLDEIHAGVGDDIVDMTSQRFAYVGSGVTIYGGDGNDVIWSNKGNNKLFGDAGDDQIIGASGNDVIVGGAGDDTMHGGGGKDIFTFGGNWGNDTVEQLDGGSVTLWFEDGSEENWNADTRTYTDGENTVTVSGTADVTLKFGGDISSFPDGIFSNAVTKKIFESTLA